MVQQIDPPHEADDVTLGGRYRVESVLGRGGMADVYRATDVVLDREVAVKVLREPTLDAGERARFVQEARTLARLDHPGLVTVLDAALDEQRPFLVMELVPGTTLREHCAEPCSDTRWVARIGAQVADALAAVHGAGVVHRDVKPGNILVDGDRAWLTDFGIARLLSDVTGHTRTGMTIGTAAYLAPEQLTGDPVTGAADVYALGLVLLEVLTGTRAYSGVPAEAALARLHQPVTVPTDLPAPWRALVAAMTAREAPARPAAPEVADELRALADTGSAETDDLPTATAVLEQQTAVLDPRTVVLTQTPSGPAWPAAATVHRVREWVRRQPALALLAGAGVLVALGGVAVAATAGSGESERTPSATVERDADGLPTNLPAEFREPLGRLHDAVRR
ncbi:serine/threonine-protein kinase [Nocardioides massiliensis]|uniref:non-specific serine/threonine protein kinase n=1 Tax=Nocardioides massiliensis TaxID=1325935 RepID=A0ABT9NJG6_9ACTN|nr:serine/threonine-protein kinase [Nocardioides massiliensis]MDP9820566.1 serine/threonine protein kinase [Nocardioides massiliensis]